MNGNQQRYCSGGVHHYSGSSIRPIRYSGFGILYFGNNFRDRSEVPEGYTAYYAFDQRPDKTSTRYTGPVPMMEGEHIFYVVLENQDGQLGRVASRTYIYEEIPEPTPTPTSRPTSTPTPTSRPTSKPTVTAEPTPTPTNSPEPTPTAEPTPEPTDSPDNGSDTQE